MAGPNSLRLEVDKPFYNPGDTINGILQVYVTGTIKVRNLDIHLYGREKVTIDPPVYTPAPVVARKGHYSSTNEMLNVGLRLFENATLNPGDRDLPFQFQLPPDALPSYVGTYADVNWKLSARANIPWGSDLTSEVYLRILAFHSENPSPVSVENTQGKPRLRLELPSNIFGPGDTIEGKLTLLDPGNLRTVRLQTIQSEDAMARGAFTTAHRTQNRAVGQTLEVKRDQLQTGSPIPFRLQIAPWAPSSYRGVYSSVSLSVAAVLDIPHSEDVHVYMPILVGLRGKPTAQPQAPMANEKAREEEMVQTVPAVQGSYSRAAVVQAEPARIGEPSLATSEEKNMDDARRAILQILGDGSSKDLINISTELQVKTEDFLDLNQVKKLCEDLVAQGKLRRTAEGEFFAKYSLGVSGPQQ